MWTAFGRRATIFALAAAVGLAPTGGRAFELFGINFFGSDEDEEPPSPDAQPYTIEFSVVGDDDDLEDKLKSASSLYSEREEVPVSTAAFLARARGDYARIVASLYTEGRYGGSVTITAAGREPVDIAPDADLPDPVAVTVTVDPGPVFNFGRIAIENAPGEVPDDDEVPETPEELGLVPGEVAKSTVVLQSEQSLIGTWRELGHPKAAIGSRDAVANHPTDTLDVAIAVAPGPWAVIGPVTVTGTERMDPEFVARYSALEPGKAFDPDDIEEAQEQMRRLEVFQSARIIEADTVNPDGTLPIGINVAERPRRVYGVGASYSSLDGAGVETYWQHRNLFGQAERLRLDARVGGIGGANVAEYDYYVGADFLKPGIIGPYTDLTALVFGKQDDLESYLERTVAARVGLAHRFFDDLEGRIAVNVERSRIEDPLGARNFMLVSLPGELIYDSRDNELNPTEGFRVAVNAEPFTEFEFSNTGLITRVQGSTYFGFGGDDNDRVVLAARLGVGSIVGAPRDEIPASRLFFAGGGSSVRGYAYRNIGIRLPEDPLGLRDYDVLGGRSYYDASLEVRVKVTDAIGVVPFVDIGSVFESSIPDFSEDPKVGAGIGLRYNTGLGPLRFDVAVPLNPEDGDPSVAFYIGLGQSF